MDRTEGRGWPMSEWAARVRDNWLRVQERIDRACRRSGRSPEDVTVVAVTKYLDVDEMRQLLELGFEHVGENRAQAAVKKWEQLGERGTWHFIGHLQTNKVKDVLGRFHYIHSLDRLSLAQELDKRAAKAGEPVTCFLQVNVSGEATKSGVPPDEVKRFVEAIGKLQYIRVVGLMTMAPKTDDPETTRPIFRRLRELRDEVQAMGIPNVPAKHLSMGMSGDFEVAVEEGATFVRLGQILYDATGKGG